MFNRTTVYVLIIALATAAGLWSADRFFPAAPAGQWPATRSVKLFTPARTLPAFSLRQSDGTPLVPGELKGHWTLVFLGFTSCPDICPTTLIELAKAQKQWTSFPDSTRPRVLFISVDPERDTPSRIGDYAHAFHRDTLAATADVPALEQFARSLSLMFAKVPVENGGEGDYTMDHSAMMAVLDPQGRMTGFVRPPLDPQAIADDFTALTKASSP